MDAASTGALSDRLEVYSQVPPKVKYSLTPGE